MGWRRDPENPFYIENEEGYRISKTSLDGKIVYTAWEPVTKPDARGFRRYRSMGHFDGPDGGTQAKRLINSLACEV